MKITFQGPVTDSVTSVVAAVSGTALDVRTADSFTVVSAIAVDTNAAGIWAAASLTANHVTITGHGYKTGLVGQVTTAGGLPTGLSTSTNYYIIVVDANTVKFASSYANALAGTAIAITGGSGNSTFTPTALAGATVVGQWSNDNSVWINDGSPTTISAAANFGVKVAGPVPYSYYKLTYAITAGSLTVANVSTVNQAK